MAFHSVIFLDYYLTLPPGDFVPVLPFTKREPGERPQEAIDDLIPDAFYSKEEILENVRQARRKCRMLIDSLTDEKMDERFTEGNDPGDMDFPILEILLYNLRHTQHHVAQLNLMLRQDLDRHLEWSFQAGDLGIPEL